MVTTTVKQALQRATPESQGISSAAILGWVEGMESQVHELQSFMLVRHGKVVAEGWWSPYGHDIPHMLFSLSKSFTSTAIGLAVAEGRLSIDDTVLSFFPDETPTQPSENWAAMRVRHLLSMSSGHDVDTQPAMVNRADGMWTKGFFTVPVIHAPGTHFLYNTGATYMLSAIIQKVTGEKLIDYLSPRLFEPLGIENPVWEISPEGISTGGFGLNIRTEDIANFGQLYLQKGMWEGRQLVPEAWVAEATKFQVANAGSSVDWQQGYGFQFWRCQHNAYRGDGAFGQFCIVMPEQDAVLAMTSGMPDLQQPLDVVWDKLLPALGSAGSLPEDAAAQDKLTKKLASLNLLTVQGKAGSAQVKKVSGKTYKVDANDLKIESVVFNKMDSTPTVTIKKADQSAQIITCEYGVWQQGQTTFFNDFWETEPKPIATSGAWTFDDTFTMVVRVYKTPFFHTFTFQFTGDNLTIQTRVNAGFAPPKVVTLTAHSISY
jgi:CubicO group peptidase (beta-lactamase class C family)